MGPFELYSYISFVLIASILSSRVEGGCEHPIYCRGPVLATLQTARLFNDSKQVVDMPLRATPQQVLTAFEALQGNYTKPVLLDFLRRYFAPAGSDVVAKQPQDWLPSPPFLQGIKDPAYREFALAVHGKWRDLVRDYNRSAWVCADCTSAIDVQHPFVVAGGRFREYYYWDSLFILDGLIVSDMLVTARGMLENMLSLVDRFGFFPNGGRVYYLNRSQPPVLSLMLKLYDNRVQDLAFLARAVPTLDAEYQFWMRQRSVSVKVGSTDVTLNIYNVSNSLPRPESWYEDVETASQLPDLSSRQRFYANLAAGAETGWDFSSRWFATTQLSSIKTSEIVPVDLNCILFEVEQTLASFHKRLGNVAMSDMYLKAAEQRKTAIKMVFWNEEASQWFDYDWVARSAANRRFYPSNLMPMWSGASHLSSQSDVDRVLEACGDALRFPGGVPTSFVETGQQWDGSNAWPPLQWFVIEALRRYDTVGVRSKQLVNNWVHSNYCAWNQTLIRGGHMFEKYDARRVGLPGGGGEYLVQEGFGWTNGVVLRLLHTYGANLISSACGT